MATPADFTTRARDEMYSIYMAYQALSQRVNDLSNEVAASGGVAGLYGADGANWPAQSDGFTLQQMTQALNAVKLLVNVPEATERNRLIRARR